ncbi:hypothetical protein [Kribbella sp. DT2]|uniref:hypothetical protein n=1 Tax=Kribbella sp. DT2 TaxID=3393427 RepID=UPI003CF0F548
MLMPNSCRYGREGLEAERDRVEVAQVSDLELRDLSQVGRQARYPVLTGGLSIGNPDHTVGEKVSDDREDVVGRVEIEAAVEVYTGHWNSLHIDHSELHARGRRAWTAPVIAGHCTYSQYRQSIFNMATLHSIIERRRER